MSLKQIESAERINFLKRFVLEILINLEEPRVSKEIEIQKLKQKFFEPVNPETVFEKSIITSFFQKPVYSSEIKKEFKKELPLEKREFFRKAPMKHIIKPRLHRQTTPWVSQISKTRRFVQPPLEKQPIQKTPEAISAINPEAQQRPGSFSLGKLEPLIRDISIQSIECSGPGKNVLVKRYGKVNVTQTILTQKEITDVINNFSEKARIPIVGGILKAAVGDLVLSAIISEFIGSRFIINKITFYDLIER